MRERAFIQLLPAAGAFCLVLLILAAAFINQQQETKRELYNRRVNVEKRLTGVAESLTSAMRVRLNLTSSLNAFVTTHRNFTPRQFDDFAQLLQEDLPGVMSLQLAPDGIVTYLTNYERNKRAVGHNLLADPKRRDLAERSIRERTYIIAGPIKLIQGGRAIIARRPMFFADAEGKTEAFWGFATVLIDIDLLIRETALDGLKQDFELAIRGKDGLGAKGEVFFGDKSTFDAPLATANIRLPNASWQIAVAEKSSGLPPGSVRSAWYWVIVFIVAIVSAIAAYLIIDRPRRLRHDINEATQTLTLEVRHRKEAEEKVRYMAQHDLLTGLPNRYLFDELSKHALARARREHEKCAVLFIDIDGFKFVNDTLGHIAGDALLKKIGERLSDRLRESDVVARFGGDEFLVLLTDKGHVDGVTTVAKEIIAAIAEPFEIDNNPVTVGACVGIAIHPEHGDSVDELLHHSDAAMYVAKATGKGTYHVFRPASETDSGASTGRSSPIVKMAN